MQTSKLRGGSMRTRACVSHMVSTMPSEQMDLLCKNHAMYIDILNTRCAISVLERKDKAHLIGLHMLTTTEGDDLSSLSPVDEELLLINEQSKHSYVYSM